MSGRAKRSILDRFADRAAVDRLLRAAERTVPGVEFRLEAADGDGRGSHAPPARRRAIRTAGRTVAFLLVEGPSNGTLDRVLDSTAAALELALVEATARRAVSAEALEAYRELSLLERVAATVGAATATTEIGPAVLAEARRAVRAEAGAMLGSGGSGIVPPATAGDPGALASLLREGRDVIARAEESACAVIGDGSGAGAGRVLVAPLTTGGRLLGTLVLGRGAGAEPFTAGDQKLAVALAQHAAIAYERVSLHALDAHRERLEQEMAVGRRIQQGLLPQTLPQPRGWELAAAYEPAREVGGDFYDVFPMRGRRATLGIVIADVTGKGIPAALMMAFARPLLRAAADQGNGPVDALERSNLVLVRERPTQLFITVFHGELQLRTGRLRYAVAGHEPPLLISGDGGRTRRLRSGGMLLGATERPALEEHTVRLAPGDLVLAYTDGVTDARRADGVRFEDERLARVARRWAGSSAADVVRAVVNAVGRFQGQAPAADDIALLAIRRASRRGLGLPHASAPSVE